LEAIDLASIFTIAFLGSFGHCVGMCGGIVIAYTSAKVDSQWNRTRESLSHLLYSFGRVTTYVVLGALFGYLGSVATFDGTTRGALLIFAGVVMLLTGLSLLGKLKFLTLIEHSLLQNSWYQKYFKVLIQDKSLFSFYLLGMLNGLLPCGLVYFFAVTAASTASPLYGALVMFVFGVSTIPALFSLGFFVSMTQKSSFRSVMMQLAAIAVILYAVFTIYNGYDFMTNPARSILQCH
jgi:sulfite exporter TauE/SafE